MSKFIFKSLRNSGLGKAVLIAATVGALMASGAAGAQKLYKWVDKDGNVHYSDQVPPEQVDNAREQLNRHGVVVEKVERAKTQEEIAAEIAAVNAEMARQAEIEKQVRADRKILAQYASEEDIVRMRDQRIETLNRQINSAQAVIDSHTLSLADLTKRASELESQGFEVSEGLSDSITVIQQQIDEQEEQIALKEAEKLTIISDYERELARFREVANRQAGVNNSEG